MSEKDKDVDIPVEEITNEVPDDEGMIDVPGVEPQPMPTFASAPEPEAVEEIPEVIEPPVDDVAQILKEQTAYEGMVLKDKIHRAGPYTYDGFNVFDNKGQRVAMAGTDQNRSASGPAFAQAIAQALNKMAGY